MVLAISVVLAFPKSYKTLALPKVVLQGLGIITGSTHCGMVIPAPIVLIGVYMQIISNYEVYHFFDHGTMGYIIFYITIPSSVGAGSCASEGDNASGSSEPIPSCHCRFLWAASHSEIWVEIWVEIWDLHVLILWKYSERYWKTSRVEHQLELLVELVGTPQSPQPWERPWFRSAGETCIYKYQGDKRIPTWKTTAI